MVFESFLDFDHDGELSSLEMAAGFALGACIADEMRQDELRDGLDSAGLDAFDLSMMDDDERAQVLEDNGLDPYDYEEMFD